MSVMSVLMGKHTLEVLGLPFSLNELFTNHGFIMIQKEPPFLYGGNDFQGIYVF